MKKRIILPKEFKARYSKILGRENKRFLNYCMRPLRKSIRINTLKTDKEKCLKLLKNKGWKLTPIPWCNDGFWVDGEKIEEKLGNTLEYFMGYYYIQEASSMIPPAVLRPTERDFVLDIAASPGSKTGQMAQMMKNKGCIIANDVRIERLKMLKYNLEKLGVINTVVTKMDGRRFWKTNMKFDKILVDAPCSSEGTVRKNWKALSRWSPELIRYISNVQKHLLDSAVRCLKSNGILVYSTCTLAPEENEGVIDYVLKKYQDLDVVKVSLRGLKYREGLKEWDGREYDDRVTKCARIWPQDNDTEGFFVAKLVRK